MQRTALAFFFFLAAILSGRSQIDTARLFSDEAGLRNTPFLRALLSGRSPALFPILVEGKWGYIDKKGDVILSPRYRAAGRFAEGLAPVRSRGTYGYIGPGGQFVIEPRFDYAEPFEEGIPRVYLDGKPYFINRFGQVLFEHPFEEIEAFGPHSYAIVKAASGKYGLINREGRLLADTVFQLIRPFSDGRAIVEGLGHNPYPEEEVTPPKWEVGVIDTTGALAVPFGRYRSISDFHSGLTNVELYPDEEDGEYREGVLSLDGALKFMINPKRWWLNNNGGHFSEGLAGVSILLIDPDTVQTWPTGYQYAYAGAANENGEIVFSNRAWEELTPFHRGRAFARDTAGLWILIDRQGRKVGRETYKEILFEDWAIEPERLFEDGVAFGKTSRGWCAIDTNGAIVAGPPAFEITDNFPMRKGKFLFFTKDISLESEEYSFLYGFWNAETGILVEPQFHSLSRPEPYNGVLIAVESERHGYIDEQGRYLWREPPRESTAALLPLDIDYMNRGYYYASSPYREELSGHGGWGGSQNSFRKISRTNDFQDKALSLAARPRERAPWRGEYEGFQLYLANTTQDTFFFDAQDSRLYLKIQALDKNGEWRDVEYLPNSWCGNSYHSLFLPPGHFWAFTAPDFNGEFSTHLRAELWYKEEPGEEEGKILHSNEFRGGVNPAQFWRKLLYTPASLMDPYEE